MIDAIDTMDTKKLGELSKMLEDKLKTTSREDWLALYDEYQKKRTQTNESTRVLIEKCDGLIKEICHSSGLEREGIANSFINKIPYYFASGNQLFLQNDNGNVLVPTINGEDCNIQIESFLLCRKIINYIRLQKTKII